MLDLNKYAPLPEQKFGTKVGKTSYKTYERNGGDNNAPLQGLSPEEKKKFIRKLKRNGAR